jgi:hypothetical protein
MTRRPDPSKKFAKNCLSCGKTFHVYAINLSGQYEKKYCTRKCYEAHDPHFAEDRDTKLWRRIDRRGPDECWPYTGATDRRGYGRPGYGLGLDEQGRPKTKRYYAHRRVYELLVGPIPEGKILLHTCDNPPCCNPAHLRVGTDADNKRDSIAKDRHARGERTRRNVLTEDLVLEIREEFRFLSERKTNAKELAEKYGVAPGTVYLAATGRTWSHLK